MLLVDDGVPGAVAVAPFVFRSGVRQSGGHQQISVLLLSAQTQRVADHAERRQSHRCRRYDR